MFPTSHTHGHTWTHTYTSTHIPQGDLPLRDEMRGPGTFQLASLEQSLTELGSKQNLQLRPLPALLPPWGSTIPPGFYLSVHPHQQDRVIGGSAEALLGHLQVWGS